MGHCQNYKRVAYASIGRKEALFTRLRCKQWSCEECANLNAWLWRQWLGKRLPELSSEWYLVTLTANREDRTTIKSLQNIRENIDVLFKRVKRVFGKVSYVRVYEKHPTSDALHVHMIVSGLSPYVAVGCSSKLRPMAIGVLSRTSRNGVWSVKTWFKKICGEIGMGYIADVQLIADNPVQAMWYVTKYLTKSQQDIPIKGLRHVQTTTDIGAPKFPESEYIWQVGSYIVPEMFEPNTKIHDINTGATIDNSYWEVHRVYPWDD